MRIIDEEVLDEFRSKRKCERCKAKVSGCEPHHIFCRGRGSASRLDTHINLIGLCAECHRKFHDGNVDRSELLEIVAKRERLTADKIEETIHMLLRSPGSIGMEGVEDE